MTKYLIVLIWPIGIALIAGIALLLARRSQSEPAAAASSSAGRDAGRAAGRAGRHHSHGAAARQSALAAWRQAGLVAVLAAAGAVVVFALMCLLGMLVTHSGPAIDKPIFTFVHGHHAHIMGQLMKRLTKIGDTWTCWGAAAAAAACLSVTWRSHRLVPPVALAALIVIDHYTTLALRHVFHRLGPPTSPLGTFPSGGCDRCIVFYGLIAYLLWREFSGRRATAMLAGGAVAALGFNEAYSRVYLSLHWFTDAVSGLIYGTLLLIAFIAAIQLVIGRAAAVRSWPPPAPALGPGPRRASQVGQARQDGPAEFPASQAPVGPPASFWPDR